ncbi:hypothetical protein V5O48_004050 [Marasmius crinis-equi]|uniref:ubiquitinyl hydrolase 1 n=1 Tax=Marasmius crinis-equi TaxID=585013 RepID=A0ABR3FR60_9AGAR
MAQKRKRRASPSSKGLAAGEVLKRERLAGGNATTTPWGWVGTEVNVKDASQITQEHYLTVYGLSSRSRNPRCRNKYKEARDEQLPPPPPATATARGELEEDVIIVSDDEEGQCNKKDCKFNPFCLNYLGQEKWEDEDKAQRMWEKSVDFGSNPKDVTRTPGTPVGLKNLGATCYANASLQVWFRDLNFRAGVYSCRSTDEAEDKFMESPIFQLQVTFTALQESIQKVFNPTKLVESLQLRISEQQDAQEFSKLFMSHLDAEFKKQSNPRVKSLVTDQFEGEQVYGTACSNCQNKSERTSNFLELEINFQNKSKLSDCIRSLLQPEELSGDNQYRCSHCEGLQDATRYTELRRLPPVLHFSLLRFVFDLATLERKKSKNIISFPREIDMGPFIRESSDSTSSSTNIYELRGILLHKGSSAYHGHYEAQVYDSEAQSWFQFNDEVVTRINRLGDSKNSSTSENKQPPAKRNNQTTNSRKRQRVEDSDEEVVEVPPAEVPLSESFISSKDAYMLIYVRKSLESSSEVEKPVPSAEALKVVEDMNSAHAVSCEEYRQKEETSLQAFQSLRAQVMDIYRTWELTSEDQDLVVANRKTLEGWLSNERMSTPNPVQQEILCEHGKLDYNKAKELKCIKRSTYDQLKPLGGFEPIHTLEDLCDVCVRQEFAERLYQIEHPRLVAQFNELDHGPENSGYWISKAWIRDWLLQKPKMHTTSYDDPPPDAPDYDQVHCEHGKLSLNTVGRRRISVEACEMLTGLFPQWNPVPIEEEACSVCEALLYERKSSSLEHRKRAEEEKIKLKRMYDHACNAGLTGTNSFLENVNLAIIPSSFFRRWRLWLTKPSENDRPEALDNSVFFCEHDMLLFDPRTYHLDEDLAAILREEWDVLAQMYPAGPLIAVQRREGDISCALSVCDACRHRLKVEWEITDIIVRIGPKDRDDEGQSKAKKQRTATYGSRQSRRLRQLRRDGETRRVPVTKETTIKEIKVTLQKLLNIPTICQRLFYKSRELDDGSVTVGSLGVLANDVFEFQEQNEVHEIIDSDEGEHSATKRDEGKGFGGTVLLGGSRSPTNGKHAEETTELQDRSSPHELRVTEERPCSACTFINSPDATSCNICGSNMQ